MKKLHTYFRDVFQFDIDIKLNPWDWSRFDTWVCRNSMGLHLGIIHFYVAW